MSDINPRVLGKQPILEGIFNTSPERPSAELVERLAASSTADLSDLVGRLYTMTPEIHPLYATCPSLSGTAVTVRTPRGDNKAVKEAIAEIRLGDVLVIDAQGFTDWCCGGYGMLREATREGLLAGVVVHGAYRDVKEFEAAGLALYGIALNPATGPKIGPGQVNVPVSCGNVVVYPGDIVIADSEGVVVVPSAHAAIVADARDTRNGDQGRR